jgi:hypothetical protein
MADSENTVVTFYDGFLDKEWYDLRVSVQCELVSFLRELQANPTDPKLKARCDIDHKGRLAYALPDGYWVFCELSSKRGDDTST